MPDRVLPFFLNLTFILCLVSITTAQGASLDPKRVKWKKLQFSTSFLLVSATADIEWQVIDSDSALEQLVPIDNALMPSDAESLLMTLTSHSFNRHSRVNFWFDKNSAALQRIQHDWGKRNRIKTYRFANSEALAFQRTPKESEKELPNSQWTHKEQHKYAYPELPPGTIVSDNAALFYILSAAQLRKVGDSITVYSFAKQYVNKIQLKVNAEVEIETDYKQVSQSGADYVEEPSDTLEITFTATPYGGNSSEEFEFLGLKGDIKVYLDRVTFVPVQIRGKVDYLGSMVIDLVEVHLRQVSN